MVQIFCLTSIYVHSLTNCTKYYCISIECQITLPSSLMEVLLLICHKNILQIILYIFLRSLSLLLVYLHKELDTTYYQVMCMSH